MTDNKQAQNREVDKLRLAMAARIAAGMAANPCAYESRSWSADIAHSSWALAGALIRIAETGGA